MKIKLLYLFSFLFLIFSACSSSEETTNTDTSDSQPEIYVFDDVTEPADSTEVNTQPPPPTVEDNTTKYYVQVGAFTSKERADQFVSENSSKSKYSLEISYNDDVKLYVVRIPPFISKDEAEKVRNEFWKSGLFNDAFIVTK